MNATVLLLLMIQLPGQQPQQGKIDVKDAQECVMKSAEILSHYRDVLKAGGALSTQCVVIVPPTGGA